jgi:hypothetical protein
MVDPARAYVSWSQLRTDLVLLGLAILAPVGSFICDVQRGCHDWFARSGAITVLLAAYLAYRSLGRHYEKFFRNVDRGTPLRTSTKQLLVDRLTVALLLTGTIIWAYGDKLFEVSCK